MYHRMILNASKKSIIYFLIVVSLAILIGLISGCKSGKSTLSKDRVPIAKNGNDAYNQYIERYAGIAYSNQKKYKIPASITLAQGLLESGAGSSTLARKANNHFGIKCHNSWRGARTFHTDDLPNECFRKYNSPEESFADHADFLRKPRYSRLFKLDPRDYKGWAKGLQQCGYATDKGYANKLIKIIEDYRLYLIDRGNLGRHYKYEKPSKSQSVARRETRKREQNKTLHSKNYRLEDDREYFLNGSLLFIQVKSDDSLASIAAEFNISEKKLSKYNDLPEGCPLTEGDLIYLQPKLSKAQPPNYLHKVSVGESIHTIAQMYGIKLKSLYRLNNLSKDYIPEEGDMLKLR